MSLPQTECGSPPGEQARVIVCPSVPFSEVALAAQVVGVAAPVEAGWPDAGLEFDGAVLVWPPPPALALSFFIFAQPAVATVMAMRKSTTQWLRFVRLVRDKGLFLVWYEGVTETFLSFIGPVFGGVRAA